MWIHILLLKGYIYQSSRSKRCIWLLGYYTPESIFFEPRIRITKRNLNQSRKYFNPLFSCPGRLELGKKQEFQQSCLPVARSHPYQNPWDFEFHTVRYFCDRSSQTFAIMAGNPRPVSLLLSIPDLSPHG